MSSSRRVVFTVLSALLLAIPARLPAQGLIALLNPGGDRQLGAFALATGDLHGLGSPVGGASVSTSGGTETVDRGGNRLFFIGTPSGNPTKLFVRSTIDGGVAGTEPNVSGTGNGVMFMDWDDGESKLFALLSVGSGDRQLASVNLSNGVFSTIGAPLAGASLGTGSSHTLDAAGNRFLFSGFLGGVERIYSVSTTTGSVLNGSPPPQVTGVLGIQRLAWDSDDAALVGLFTNNSGQAQLGTLNVATGAVSLLGNPIEAGTLSTSAIAADSVADLLYLVGTPSGQNRQLYTLSTVSGNAVVTPVETSGAANDVLALVFDAGALFADGFESQTLAAWSAHVP